MKIILHIGVHKTATTHIQSLLQSGTDLLKENGVTVSLPKTLRQEWLGVFLSVANKADEDITEAEIQRLRQIAPNGKRWIVSEENFAGIPYDFMVTEGFYPNVKRRLALFKRLFPHADIELFFSVRRYDRFYRSLYLEVVRNRGYIPFEKYYREESFSEYSWKAFLDRVTQVIPEEKITLWCYEEIAEILPAVIDKMAGFACYGQLAAKYATKRTRPSLSAKALEMLASEDLNEAGDMRRERVEKLLRMYPVGDLYPAFQPFDMQKQYSYQNKYNDDMQAVRQAYPRLCFMCSSEVS